MLAGILELPNEIPLGFILFSHCFTCNKDLKAIVRISRELAERGWGVLRYDFSGLGGSSGDFRQTNFSTNRFDLQRACFRVHLSCFFDGAQLWWGGQHVDG
jgi:putative redox protein